MPRVDQLASGWRQRATDLRRFGAAEGPALAWEQAADELEMALNEEENSLLDLRQAAAECGFSAEHLGRLIREGKIPNAGAKNRPRVRRGDLPLKPRSRTTAIESEVPDSERIYQDIAYSKQRRHHV
jgi:hypothetical protein